MREVKEEAIRSAVNVLRDSGGANMGNDSMDVDYCQGTVPQFHHSNGRRGSGADGRSWGKFCSLVRLGHRPSRDAKTRCILPAKHWSHEGILVPPKEQFDADPTSADAQRTTDLAPNLSTCETTGTVIGHYRLLQKIEADLAVLKDIEYAD